MTAYCPKCNKELELPEDIVGRKVRCCYCEETFVVDENFWKGQKLLSEDVAIKETLTDIFGKNATQRFLDNSNNEDAAKRGDVQAQFMVGEFYYSGVAGDGIIKNHAFRNYEKAYKWFNLAAENGHPDAQNYLGLMYLNGHGVAQNYEESVKWFQMAANQGNADAQYNLAARYAHGDGGVQNICEAMKWYLKAAEKGHLDAQEKLGLMYYSRAHSGGADSERNYAEAAKWYLKAAEGGHVGAQSFIGLMYEKGEGVAKDYSEAFYWRKRAAEQGNMLAQLTLARMYMDGLGIPKDYDKADMWFRRVVEHGSADIRVRAMWWLGSMYGKTGENQDFTESAKWYRMAAECGDYRAQFELGEMYLKGFGVPQDNVEAVKWYRMAAEHGSEVAKLKLRRLEESRQLSVNNRSKDKLSCDDFDEWEHDDKQMNHVMRDAKKDADNSRNASSGDVVQASIQQVPKVQCHTTFAAPQQLAGKKPAFGKKIRKMTKDEVERRVGEVFGKYRIITMIGNINPYCYNVAVEEDAANKETIIKAFNELFHAFGVLSIRNTLDVGGVSDYCEIYFEEGWYCAPFNDPVVMSFEPDDKKYKYVMKEMRKQLGY